MSGIFRRLLVVLLALLPMKAGAQEFDMDSYLYGHVLDSYEWHITTVRGKPVSIPLPVILISRTGGGVSCFMSSRLADGASWKGYSIAPDGSPYEGKIVETDASGEQVRPIDLSITKTVSGMLISAALLVGITLSTSRWYSRHDVRKEAPKGVYGLMEMLVMMIEDDVIKPSIGEGYRRYSPYLLTAFFFILFNNMLGIIPFFPGGANVTGNINITFILAVCTFLAINLFGTKKYWKDIFWPEVPTWLKVPVPLMPVIELVGVFTKPFTLMIRLFANMLAGHFMILGVIAVIFITAEMGAALCAGLGFIAVVMGIFMDCLELLVAFLQAYIFTMLSAVFIGLAHPDAVED